MSHDSRINHERGILTPKPLSFTHKAGIHAKAILADPTTYEVLNPSDFGMTRYGKSITRFTCNIC